jgi:hypothetical protein
MSTSIQDWLKSEGWLWSDGAYAFVRGEQRIRADEIPGHTLSSFKSFLSRTNRLERKAPSWQSTTNPGTSPSPAPSGPNTQPPGPNAQPSSPSASPKPYASPHGVQPSQKPAYPTAPTFSAPCEICRDATAIFYNHAPKGLPYIIRIGSPGLRRVLEAALRHGYTIEFQDTHVLVSEKKDGDDALL